MCCWHWYFNIMYEKLLNFIQWLKFCNNDVLNVKRLLWGKVGTTTSFWSHFRYKYWDVCLKGVTSWRMMTWSSEGQEGQQNYGARGAKRTKDFLKNRVIIRTGHPEISRPAKFRTPSLKALEPLRPNMAWMDLLELHKLQQQQWLLLLEGLFQI